jgi:hypothetical protein
MEIVLIALYIASVVAAYSVGKSAGRSLEAKRQLMWMEKASASTMEYLQSKGVKW